MSEADFAKAEVLTREAQLLEMLLAQVVSRLIHLTATLRLADLLAEGPKAAEELAALTAPHAPSLSRVLRTLPAWGGQRRLTRLEG